MAILISDRAESVACGGRGLRVLRGGLEQRPSRVADRRPAAPLRPQLRRAVHGVRQQHRHCPGQF